MSAKTFVKITNEQIYQEIQELKQQVNGICLLAKETNGKVKFNRWVATTALTLVLGLILGMIGMKQVGPPLF